jgi:diguanylate cyclase (GGDEF)-like protein
MPRILRLLSTLALAVVANAAAAVDEAQALLDDFRLHGYASPLAAVQRMRSTPAPAADAPLELRWRWQVALANRAGVAGQRAVAEAARAELERMSAREQCEPCRIELLVQALSAAELANDMNAVRARQTALQLQRPPLDAQARFDWFMAISIAHDMMGEFDEAIEWAVKAGEVAAANERPADQARVFCALASSNAGRRDLARALAMAGEGYELARRIGHTYMMALLRINESYVRHLLKTDVAARRAAVLDALKLTRSAPGLEDEELLALTNVANFHNDEHEYRAAAASAREGEALARKLADEPARAYSLGNLAVALVHQGQAATALPMAREAVQILERAELKQETADVLLQLVEVADSAERPREALEALRRWAALNEELTSTQREHAVLALQERFSAERKTREIERLELENARRAAEVAAHTSQQRLWAAVAVALALAALLLAQWLGRARRRARRLEADNAKLSVQSSHDPLTAAFNRRHCEALMARLEREHGPGDVGLLLLDVDHFKAVNDTHGHAAGDAVLVHVARRLQALVRDRDAVVRWGGEEFVLVLPGTPAAALPVVAERVLAAIALEPVDIGGGTRLPVRVSGGAVAWPAWPGQRWEEALHVADMALYLSKTGGRHRVNCLAPVTDAAAADLVRQDLGAARDAGQATLRTVTGPARETADA